MSVGRTAIVVGIALMAAAVMVCVRPRRFVVDGLSMAPGLMPGDVVSTGWLPGVDGLRAPQRFDRWVVVAPDGGAALKRVAGLPGERLLILDGDLVADGEVVLKQPCVLADVAVPVAFSRASEPQSASVPAGEVLDDAPFATEVNRPLEAVRDVGLTALVHTGSAAARARVALRSASLTWLLPAHARIRVVAGRLDGHDVAVAWRDQQPTGSAGGRSGLPARVPAAWSFAHPGHDEPEAAATPTCTLEVEAPARIEQAAGWRDVQYRPARDGAAAWHLDAAEFLVLGDFPTGSVDSRQWGPLSRSSLRQRLAPR